MKIISLSRNVAGLGIPDTFVIGAPPLNNGAPIEGPEVTSIKFQETGYAKGQAYRGKCYIISFAESEIKRIVPANDNIIDVAVEMKKVVKDTPNLPE